MYANTGIATDSARVARSTRWANLLGRGCRLLFLAAPMPDLPMPVEPPERTTGKPTIPLMALKAAQSMSSGSTAQPN